MFISITMVTDGNITVLPPYECVHVSDRAKEIVKVCLSVCLSVCLCGYITAVYTFIHTYNVCMYPSEWCLYLKYPMSILLLDINYEVQCGAPVA